MSIENLNFKVILDTKEFDKQIKWVRNEAKSLNTSVSTILTQLGKVGSKQIITATGVKNAQQMVQYISEIQKKMSAMPKGGFLVGDADKLNSTLLEVNKRLDQIINKSASAKAGFAGMNSTLSNTGTLMRTISKLTGTAFSVVGIRRFLSSLIDITGQFEVQKMALRNMLQDIDAADKIYQDLYRFSSESTYRFSELAKYAKQLAAFNIDKNGLLETTKMLGDVASGVGVSMDRIILAYGHVKSSGFLRGIQLRSFAQNGVPVLEELSKMFTEMEGKVVSLGDVFDKMMKREIPFEVVEEAFKRMTSEGGKFYQMQEVLAKTLAGQINILKGRWENLLAAMGQANDGVLKGVVSSLSDIVSSTEKFGHAIKTAVVFFGAYEASMIAMAAITGTLSVATTGLAGVFGRLIGVIAKNPYALLAVGVASLTVAIMNAKREMSDSERIIRALEKATNDYNSAQNAEIHELDALVGRLRSAREGTEEYNSAKLALEKRFDPYIQKLREEGVAVDNLSTLYDGLAQKITLANKQRFLEIAQQDIINEYKTATDDIEAKIKVIISDLGRDMGRALTGAEEGALRHYINTGDQKDFQFQLLRQELEKKRIHEVVLPGSTGPYRSVIEEPTYLERLTELLDRQTAATEQYVSSMSDAATRFDVANRSITGSAGSAATELTGWRKIVDDAIRGLDKKTLQETGLKAKDDEDYYEYLDRIGKKYKELREEQDKALKENKPMYDAWVNSIRAVDKALEGNILKDARYNKEPWNGSNKNDENEKITQLRGLISVWKEYLNIYRELEPIKGNKTPEAMAELLGGSPEKYQDIEGEIGGLIAQLRELGEKGKLAAAQIEASLGMGWVRQLKKTESETEKARKEIEKYLDTLEKWTNKNKALEGTGVAFKISKAIADYRTAVADVDKKYKDVTKMPGSNRAGNFQALLNMGRDQNAALAKLRSELVGYTNEYIKEQLTNNGFDLTNWSDKTLSQVEAIRAALSKIELPDWIKDALKKQGLTDLLDEIEKALVESKENFETNTLDPEKLKLFGKRAKYAAKEVAGLASSLKDLGDATNNDTLSALGEGIDTLADYLSSASKAASEMGPVGLIVSTLVFSFSRAFSQIAEEERKAAEGLEHYTRALAEANAAYNKFLYDADTSRNTVFGEDALGSLRKQVELTRQYRDYIMYFVNSWDDEMRSRYVGQDGFVDWRRLLEELNSGVLLKDNYNLPEFKRIVEEIVAAEEALKSTTEELFGDLASSLADQFIANFKSMGNAVDDLGDTFTDLGETILSSLLQSFILDNILTKYQKEAGDMLGKYSSGQMTPEEYAEWLRGFTDNVQKESEALAPAINGLIDAFVDRGLIGLDENGANSLGSGIKSITEDTAGLLASYINAMRGDLSAMRVLQEKGWSNIEAIAGVVTPSLANYVQQIAANTYNSAEHTRMILTELQSVIGAEGSNGLIVRVQMQ